MSNTCPYCEVGHPEEVHYSEVVKAGRKSIAVQGLSKLVCSLCEGESIPLDMYERNSTLVTNAMAQSRGAVSRGLLRRLRETWNLGQREASKLFGAGPSSFAKWESGQAQLSTPSALLVQCAIKFPPVMEYLADLADVTLAPAPAALAKVDFATGWQSCYSPDVVERPVRMTFMAVSANLNRLVDASRIEAHLREAESAWSDGVEVQAANGIYLPTMLEAA